MRRLPHVSAALLGAAGVVVASACADLTNLAGGAAPGDGGGTDAPLPVTLSPASLDFGIAGCGTQVPAQTVSLENTGPTPLAYEASLPEASGFALGGQNVTTASGTVPPGGRTAFAINVASLRTLGQLATKLTIKIGEELRVVPITVTGLGAKLDVDHAIVDYGDVYYTATAGAIVTLTNAGTEAVTIDSLANLGTDFTVSPKTPLPLVVPKGGAAELKVDFAAGPAGAPIAREVMLETGSTPLCGEKPKLSLRAARVNTDVTVSPGTVDFGKQPCRASPAPRVVTVTNYGTVAAVIGVQVVPGSRFVVPVTKVTVPPAVGLAPGTATFTVGAVTVAPPLLPATENLALTVNGTSRTLAARIDPRGIILAFSPTFYNFAYVGHTRIVVVKNNGNENAVTAYASDTPAVTPGAGDTIFPGGSSNMQLVYTPPDANAYYMGKITTTLADGVVACTPNAQIDVESK